MTQLNPWVLKAKKFVTSLITSPPVASLIRLRYRDKIPSKCGLIDLSKAKLKSRTHALVYWNIYESAERRFVTKYLMPDVQTIELGASLGVISSAIAGKLSKGIKLTCVEANPNLIDCLDANLKHNASHLDVRLINAAVGYQGASLLFQTNQDNLVSRSSSASMSDSPRGNGITEVSCIQLRHILPPDNAQPFQLVCDIEGMEWELAAHESKSLENCALAVIEAHDFEDKKYTEFFQYFAGLGFKIIDQYGAVAVFAK